MKFAEGPPNDGCAFAWICEFHEQLGPGRRISDDIAPDPDARLAVFCIAVAIAVVCVLTLGVESTDTSLGSGSWLAGVPLLALGLPHPGVTSIAFLISVGIVALMISNVVSASREASRSVTIAAVAGISTIAAALPPFDHRRSESESLWSTIADTVVL